MDNGKIIRLPGVQPLRRSQVEKELTKVGTLKEGMTVVLAIPDVVNNKVLLGDIYKITRIRSDKSVVLKHVRAVP